MIEADVRTAELTSLIGGRNVMHGQLLSQSDRDAARARGRLLLENCQHRAADSGCQPRMVAALSARAHRAATPSSILPERRLRRAALYMLDVGRLKLGR